MADLEGRIALLALQIQRAVDETTVCTLIREFVDAECRLLKQELASAQRKFEHLRDIDDSTDGEVARKAGAYAHTIQAVLNG